MEIDFDTPLLNLKKEPVTRNTTSWRNALDLYRSQLDETPDPEEALKAVLDRLGEGFDSMTLGDTIAEALTLGDKANKASGKEKLRRYKLAQLAIDGGICDLNAKRDISFIDDALSEYLGTAVYGYAHSILYPDDPEEVEDAEN